MAKLKLDYFVNDLWMIINYKLFCELLSSNIHDTMVEWDRTKSKQKNVRNCVKQPYWPKLWNCDPNSKWFLRFWLKGKDVMQFFYPFLLDFKPSSEFGTRLVIGRRLMVQQIQKQTEFWWLMLSISINILKIFLIRHFLIKKTTSLIIFWIWINAFAYRRSSGP